ncbi:MAG: HTTM domain-containing protein [Planctomycetaceae bacterium]|nr:HTTM domain-containing protein [Planctomycetaceae bacterium]
MNDPRRLHLLFNAVCAQVLAYLVQSGTELWLGWNSFWFTPRRTYWLGLLRIGAGCMALYTHAVWTIDFEAFLGTDRMIGPEIAPQMNPTSWHWSHFDVVSGSQSLWALHWVAIGSFAAFTVGVGMPWTGWLAAFFAISYAHRATGALFGLDQMNVALVTYLTLGGAGRSWSVDQWWRQRRSIAEGSATSPDELSVWANIGTRLIQLQLCIIYWFAGTGKLQGVTWWNGEAMWGALASYQYQSIDMTWLHEYPNLLALATHLTIVWEISYTFLVWPKRTRPVVIGMAVLVHVGIGVLLGMMTFGVIMVIANLAFVEWKDLFLTRNETRRS